eukprot:scaffold73351_cov48-Phaeocystis_antarctica.AAC.1
MSSLLAADKELAFCRVERGACEAGRGAGRDGGRDMWGSVGASGMHGKGPTKGSRGRARAERTVNMPFMFVTLDVSKLSGWLNAVAPWPCRVERRAYDAG